MNGKADKVKFDNDMKIIKESLRLAYGLHTKKEKIQMFISDLIWGLFPIVMILGIIAGVLTLILEFEQKQFNMKQQTAVEWMAIRYHHRQGHLTLEDIAKAKEMEKEQIMKANDAGFNEYEGIERSSETYYNETYKNENNTQNK